VVAVAQLAEHPVVVREVAGSNPVGHPTERSSMGWPYRTSAGELTIEMVLDDVQKEKALPIINKRLEGLRKGIRQLDDRLTNDGYLTNVPQERFEADYHRLTCLEIDRDALEETLDRWFWMELARS
jgi:valyl-tRNA synthetase